MECIEARALKSSMLSQMVLSSLKNKNDEVWCLNGLNNVGTDDFVVEDLLNFDFPEIELQEENGLFREEEKVLQKRNSESSSSIFSGTDEFENISAAELNLPVDDLENLEWLSQFVDDSASGVSLLLPASNFSGGASAKRVEPVRRPVQRSRVPYFPLPVLRKIRSKMSRSHGRSWSLESPPLSTTESSSTSDSSTISPFVFTNRVHNWFSGIEKPSVKKLKRKPETDGGFVSGRRCMHCQVQKTPQWRTGPLGPKTLCNACGVRFKSGRLFPEYRPACSPTFSQEVHSNSHRKVLEMRRKKDMGGMVEPGVSRAVQSF